MRGLKQANIVTLHDIVHTRSSITLVFEYLDCDLKQYMEYVRSMDLNDVKIFLYQVLRGLAYCHARRILHRKGKKHFFEHSVKCVYKHCVYMDKTTEILRFLSIF